MKWSVITEQRKEQRQAAPDGATVAMYFRLRFLLGAHPKNPQV